MGHPLSPARGRGKSASNQHARIALQGLHRRKGKHARGSQSCELLTSGARKSSQRWSTTFPSTPIVAGSRRREWRAKSEEEKNSLRAFGAEHALMLPPPAYVALMSHVRFPQRRPACRRARLVDYRPSECLIALYLRARIFGRRAVFSESRQGLPWEFISKHMRFQQPVAGSSRGPVL
jgi:hypothetical protein